MNQIGVGQTLVNTLAWDSWGCRDRFRAFVRTGAKATTGEIVRGWYDRGQANARKVRKTAAAVEDKVEDKEDDMDTRPRNPRRS
ncbi:MAG: hypothetical protein ABIS17_04545 [Casimicrobiaceae bacterium]